MLEKILGFSNDEIEKLNKLINNEELSIKDNLDFYKLISEKAKILNSMELSDMTEEESKIVYYICYYESIYDDYISSLKRNSTQN